MDRTHYADGSWEPYEDFVGGIQFWGYALASGTRDGCVRMWDSEFSLSLNSRSKGLELTTFPKSM